MSAGVETSHCRLCGGRTRYLLTRRSPALERDFRIHHCDTCHSWQIVPNPPQEVLNELYQKEYFEKRTDRGYNNYLSDAVRKSVVGTLQRNLQQLNFYQLKPGTVLELGCAAGYALSHMQENGWQGMGLEVAADMAQAARDSGLDVRESDIIQAGLATGSFDLVTMWASIEHMWEPRWTAAEVARVLKPRGRVYLSTCHLGFFARIYGSNWRYLNVPEHIYYFTREGLRQTFAPFGLELHRSFTYGSGFTTRPGAGTIYRTAKRIADRMAKAGHLGDMIVCEFVKPRS